MLAVLTTKECFRRNSYRIEHPNNDASRNSDSEFLPSAYIERRREVKTQDDDCTSSASMARLDHCTGS